MKAVLISVQPKWCEPIAYGKKTVEVRKTRPKIKTPFKCYICQTTKNYINKLLDTDGSVWEILHFGRGKVIGEFVCDEIYDIGYSPYNHGGFISNTDNLHEKSCLDLEQMFNYLSQGYGYGWHISNLVIYDKPKELNEFITFCSEWEKEYFTNKCLRCKYCFSNCADMRHECTVEGEKPLTRPPQSWCYVEEVKQ